MGHSVGCSEFTLKFFLGVLRRGVWTLSQLNKLSHISQIKQWLGILFNGIVYKNKSSLPCIISQLEGQVLLTSEVEETRSAVVGQGVPQSSVEESDNVETTYKNYKNKKGLWFHALQAGLVLCNCLQRVTFGSGPTTPQ